MTAEEEIKDILLKINMYKSYFSQFQKLYEKAQIAGVPIFYGYSEPIKEKLDEYLNIFRIRLGKLRGE